MPVKTQIHAAKQENDEARSDQKVERNDRVRNERIKGLRVKVLHVPKRFPHLRQRGKRGQKYQSCCVEQKDRFVGVARPGQAQQRRQGHPFGNVAEVTARMPSPPRYHPWARHAVRHRIFLRYTQTCLKTVPATPQTKHWTKIGKSGTPMSMPKS